MIPRTARPSRRSVVGVAAAGLLSGCSAGRGSAPAGRQAASAPPGSAQRARAAGDSLALLARYDAALAAHPGLGALLRPLRAEVARHVTAFGGHVPEPSGHGTAPSPAVGGAPVPGVPDAPVSASPGTTVTTPGGVATAPPGPAAAGTSAPPTPAAALTALAATERDLAGRRTADLAAVPGQLARLLASVAACAAGHAVLLTAEARRVKHP